MGGEEGGLQDLSPASGGQTSDRQLSCLEVSSNQELGIGIIKLMLEAASLHVAMVQNRYRVAHLLADLGWAALDLGSSPGRLAVLQLQCCLSKTGEHPKSKSTKPSPRGDGPPCREYSQPYIIALKIEVRCEILPFP